MGLEDAVKALGEFVKGVVDGVHRTEECTEVVKEVVIIEKHLEYRAVEVTSSEYLFPQRGILEDFRTELCRGYVVE